MDSVQLNRLHIIETQYVKVKVIVEGDMSHSQMLGKFEYGGGPIFKVVLEC